MKTETTKQLAERITREHALHSTGLALLAAAEESGLSLSREERKATTHGY